jgi:hypothetical protein
LRLETEVLERQLMSYEQQQLSQQLSIDDGSCGVSSIDRKIHSDSQSEENDFEHY